MSGAIGKPAMPYGQFRDDERTFSNRASVLA